jgi:hypothetical protein
MLNFLHLSFCFLYLLFSIFWLKFKYILISCQTCKFSIEPRRERNVFNCTIWNNFPTDSWWEKVRNKSMVVKPKLVSGSQIDNKKVSQKKFYEPPKSIWTQPNLSSINHHFFSLFSISNASFTESFNLQFKSKHLA